MRLSDDQVQKVLLADSYIRDGIPLKDAMDTDEVEDVILVLADFLKQAGYELEEE